MLFKTANLSTKEVAKAMNLPEEILQRMIVAKKFSWADYGMTWEDGKEKYYFVINPYEFYLSHHKAIGVDKTSTFSQIIEAISSAIRENDDEIVSNVLHKLMNEIDDIIEAERISNPYDEEP